MIVIGILIIIFLICAVESYIPVLLNTPMVMGQLGIMVLICVVTCIAVCKRKNKYMGYSDEQVHEIWDAQEADTKNAEENERRRKEAIRRNEEEIKSYQNQIRTLQEKMRPYEAKLMQLDILGRDEWNLDAVDFLIKTLESHRANDIAGALQLYDAEARRKHDAALREIDRMLERQKAEWEREEQRRRDEEQRRHNDRMEDLERQRLKEAEKARKEIERLTSN